MVNVSGRLLARNTVFNIAGQAIPALVAMASIPATIHGLGPERFGLIGLAWVVLGYFTFLDLGMGYAATRLVADALGRNDLRRVPPIVGSAGAVQIGVGLVGAAVLFAAAPFLVDDFLRVAATLRDDAVRTFRILSAGVPLVLLTASLRAILSARQRFGLINAITIPASVVNFLIPLAGALWAWSLAQIAALLLAGRVAAMLAFLVLAAREIPGLVSGAAPRQNIVRELLGFGLWTAITNALAGVFTSLDRFLLGSLRNMTAVGFYTAPQELVLRLSILPASLTATLFPALTTLDARKEVARVRELYARSLRFLSASVGAAALLLVAIGPDLLRVWLGAESAAHAGIALQFLALGILVNAIAYVPSAYLHSINRPDLPAKMHLLQLPVFLGLAWLLMPRFGPAGAGAVWFARAALDTALLHAASARNGMARFEPALAWLLVVGLGAAAVVAYAVPGAALRLVVTTALLAGFLWTGWKRVLSADDRRHLSALFQPAGA